MSPRPPRGAGLAGGGCINPYIVGPAAEATGGGVAGGGKRPAMRTETQVSAGGVVVRTVQDKPQVALICVGPQRRWQLPKGLVEKGEEPEAAAAREVREEAGVDADLVAPVETTEYWYVAQRGGGRVRYHKTVHFF